MSRQRHCYGENHLHFLTLSTYRRARLFDSEKFRRRWVETLGVGTQATVLTAFAMRSGVDEHQNLEVDAPTINKGDGWAGSGANPWHLDSQTNSILFLADEGDKPVRIGVDVTSGGVHYYLIRLKMAPHETRAIDLRALRDAQVPDFKGHKIPAGATDGSINWLRIDSVPVEGRMMVIEKQQGIASSYDCVSCACPGVVETLALTPFTFSILPFQYEDLFSQAAIYDCNGYDFYYDVT